jgi:hypothetical protein
MLAVIADYRTPLAQMTNDLEASSGKPSARVSEGVPVLRFAECCVTIGPEDRTRLADFP